MSVEFWRYSSRNRSGGMHGLTLARRNLILELWVSGSIKDEIAEQVGVDVDTVSSHLQAARKAGDARAIIRHPATVLAIANVRLRIEQAERIVSLVMAEQERRDVVYALGTAERAARAGIAAIGVEAVTEAIVLELHVGEVEK